MQQLLSLLPDDILRRYQVFNYNHAAEILTQSFPDELAEIFGGLDYHALDISQGLQAHSERLPLQKRTS